MLLFTHSHVLTHLHTCSYSHTFTPLHTVIHVCSHSHPCSYLSQGSHSCSHALIQVRSQVSPPPPPRAGPPTPAAFPGFCSLRASWLCRLMPWGQNGEAESQAGPPIFRTPPPKLCAARQPRLTALFSPPHTRSGLGDPVPACPWAPTSGKRSPSRGCQPAPPLGPPPPRLPHWYLLPGFRGGCLGSAITGYYIAGALSLGGGAGAVGGMPPNPRGEEASCGEKIGGGKHLLPPLASSPGQGRCSCKRRLCHAPS